MTEAPKLRGRGRLNAFELLPPECDALVAWAAQELAAREKTQTDIYAEFVTECEKLMAEHRGELEFQIPSFSAFNRYSVRLARLTRRLDQTREIVRSLAEKFDVTESDNLTIMAAETMKSIVLHLLAEGDENLIPKDVMMLASALKQATQSQSVSSDRRQKVQSEFAAKVNKAVETVAKVKGLTLETSEAIKAQILGVQA
jgi:hypothetical protein